MHTKCRVWNVWEWAHASLRTLVHHHHHGSTSRPRCTPPLCLHLPPPMHPIHPTHHCNSSLFCATRIVLTHGCTQVKVKTAFKTFFSSGLISGTSSSTVAAAHTSAITGTSMPPSRSGSPDHSASPSALAAVAAVASGALSTLTGGSSGWSGSPPLPPSTTRVSNPAFSLEEFGQVCVQPVGTAVHCVLLQRTLP